MSCEHDGGNSDMICDKQQPTKADITFPSADSERLILVASLKRSP